jgi:hypothetical protein
MTTAIRLAAAFLTMTAMGTVTVEAQSPAAPVNVIGTWRGPFVSDGPSGIMVVTIAQEAAVWKVTSGTDAEGAPPGSEVRDFKVEGNVATWAQTYGEYEVSFKAAIDGDTMRGTMEIYQAGAVVAGGTFELKKQP